MKQSGVLRKAYLIKYEGTSKAGDGKSLREILPRSPHQLRGAPPGQARKLLVQGKLVGGTLLSHNSSVFKENILVGHKRAPASKTSTFRGQKI